MNILAITLICILSCVVIPTKAQVTAQQFSCMFPRVSAAKVQSFIPGLNAALNQFQINTVARVQMFLAQTGHETDSYNTFVEYTNRDGTNQFCGRYDGGCRFRGRGAIQLTHRYNYQRAGNELNVNFVANPDIVATPRYAFLVGGLYWKWRNLNKCSDARDLNTCTRLINGGTNGLADRRTKYAAAQRCITSLSGGGGAAPPQQQPPATQPTTRPPPASSNFGSCTANGARGTCIDTNAQRCSGTLFRNLCPGSAAIRCCVATARAEDDFVADDAFVADELTDAAFSDEFTADHFTGEEFTDMAVADVAESDDEFSAENFVGDEYSDMAIGDEFNDFAVADVAEGDDEFVAENFVGDEFSDYAVAENEGFVDAEFVDYAVAGDSTTYQSGSASGISSAAVGIAIVSALIAFIAIVVLIVILVRRKRQEDALRP